MELMTKIWYVLEKDGKQETLEFVPGINIQTYNVTRKLMQYDRDGWMIIGIDGEDPIEVKRIADEMRRQQAKGEKKAYEDLKKDIDTINRSTKGKDKLAKKSWMRRIIGK